MLRLRNLTSWPPGCTEATPEVRDKGILVGVRRVGRSLSLTILYDERKYVAGLGDWTPPPTVGEVEATLTHMLGKTIKKAGMARIAEAPLVLDELGF